jgi:hypothetical protein
VNVVVDDVGRRPACFWTDVDFHSKRGDFRMSVQTDLAAFEMRHEALNQKTCDGQTLPSSDDLKVDELERRNLLVKDQIALLQNDVTGRPLMPVPTPAGKIKTAKRMARLESSDWYESAARSIAISSRKPQVRG